MIGRRLGLTLNTHLLVQRCFTKLYTVPAVEQTKGIWPQDGGGIDAADVALSFVTRLYMMRRVLYRLSHLDTCILLSVWHRLQQQRIDTVALRQSFSRRRVAAMRVFAPNENQTHQLLWCVVCYSIATPTASLIKLHRCRTAAAASQLLTQRCDEQCNNTTNRCVATLHAYNYIVCNTRNRSLVRYKRGRCAVREAQSHQHRETVSSVNQHPNRTWPRIADQRHLSHFMM